MIPGMSHDFSFDPKFTTNLEDKSKLKDYRWGQMCMWWGKEKGSWTSHQMAMKPHGQNSTHASPKGRNSSHGGSKVRVRLKKRRNVVSEV